jgi:hypothetical protein
MTLQEVRQQALQRICLGQPEAMQFLALWHEYVHAIDDIEDTETTPEFRQRTFILALELYTCPFFKANEARLKQIVLNCTNAYADCLAWEKSPVAWQQQWVDHYRHFGAEMVIAVATICGGWDHARSLSLEQRTVNWTEHHDEAGNPV